MEFNGINITVNPPSLAGAYEDFEPGGCIILGCSKYVWEDYENARKMFRKEGDYNLIAVNHIATIFKSEYVDHICSVHHQLLGPMREMRKVRIHGHSHTHSEEPCEGVDQVWGKITRGGGTSGLFAVKIAMAMGYKKIITCGMGVDGTRHFYDPEDPKDNAFEGFDVACRMPWITFKKDNKEVSKRVRVMSGELSKIYEKPTHEWVYDSVGV